jgi:urease
VGLWSILPADTHQTVDPETYEVKADGVLCDCPPATELPLTKKHFIF